MSETEKTEVAVKERVETDGLLQPRGGKNGDILHFHQFRRAPDRLETRLEAQERGRSRHPAFRSKWRTPIDALSDPLHLCLCHWPIHPQKPRFWSRHRSGVYTRSLHWGTPLPRARPTPVFGSCSQLGSDWILFDVPQHCQQMHVMFNWKRFEPALPHMPTGIMPPMVATNMRGQQPAHPRAQVAIMVWPECQMKMVGHETIGQQPHGNTFRSLTQ